MNNVYPIEPHLLKKIYDRHEFEKHVENNPTEPWVIYPSLDMVRNDIKKKHSGKQNIGWGDEKFALFTNTKCSEGSLDNETFLAQIKAIGNGNTGYHNRLFSPGSHTFNLAKEGDKTYSKVLEVLDKNYPYPKPKQVSRLSYHENEISMSKIKELRSDVLSEILEIVKPSSAIKLCKFIIIDFIRLPCMFCFPVNLVDNFVEFQRITRSKLQYKITSNAYTYMAAAVGMHIQPFGSGFSRIIPKEWMVYATPEVCSDV